jgi:hypothetical protein
MGHASIVSYVFHHFPSQLDLVALVVKPRKYVVWSPLGLPSGFFPPLRFYTLVGGIRVLDVLLGFFSFSSFLQEVLDDDV